ncbi:adenylate kinase family protein [Candidatus Riesia pediculischaeffi]|uniref:Adenylate kinase n=1 Tax=Candidatus Riesia pediculischaeffi TaxID=428411 RepID=A0A1V0HKG3_9ENTR|nr:nucleoside monophosphate kinase [Candidatus Riesia pediculischaeffi]ARC53315.1 hypothetical protein AOQ87_01310 [Candidatus Riesia pediculischaeffi]
MIGIILIGAPCSGKGTHSEFICRRYDVSKISVGDLLRSRTSLIDPYDDRVDHLISRGRLIEDETIIDIMRKKFAEMNCRKGFLLDGFPRTVRQARSMLELVEDVRYILIELMVDTSKIMDRISGRLIHIPSNRIYHSTFNPPKKKGLDDLTGEKLEVRIDDTSEIVRKRIDIYHRCTEPLIRFCREIERVSCFKVDANKGIKDVQKEIVKILDRAHSNDLHRRLTRRSNL